MSTIYTLNGKVLKNAANDKWLAKKEAPAGFVMNASNVANIYITGNIGYISWEGPNFPNGYDGNGKHYILVNNNSDSEGYSSDYGLMYSQSVGNGGPNAISGTAMTTIGQSEGTISSNGAGTASGFGKYLTLFLQKSEGITQEYAQAYVANLTLTILDP